MMELNTTPLIDNMLVLLIMFIVTVPPQNNTVKLDLPQGSSALIDRVKDEIGVAPSGAILWNGQGVSRAELAGLLHEVAAMERPPELHLRPDAQARYEVVDEVLAIAKPQRVRRHSTAHRPQERGSGTAVLGASFPSGPAARRTARAGAGGGRGGGVGLGRLLRNAPRNKGSRGWTAHRRNGSQARPDGRVASDRCGR